MSKKQFRSQASSGRAVSGAGFGGFGTSTFGTQSSPLSYIYETPDLSGISDANVGVTFKNLMKKDSTTKAKALEDLQTYIAGSNGEIEEALLAAWVKLYPRLSIDSSRRVRQLSHIVQGAIAAKCGKRMVPYLPTIAAPWLAGTNDTDRASSRAAQDALKQTFPTPEKLHNLTKVFQQSILEYCQSAISNETVQTLSDERTVSADDAEATFARVIATTLAVLTRLISELSPEELDKQKATYEELLSKGSLWAFAAYKDVAVRRNALRLVKASLVKQKHALAANSALLSASLVDKALHSDQTGSATELLQTLAELTTGFPNVWTSEYTGKRGALQRLKQCIRKGSQASPVQYWDTLWTLLIRLPKELLPTDHEGARDVLKGLHEGVTLKDERFNASSAWSTYFKVLDLLQAGISDSDRDTLITDMGLSVVEQYLKPSMKMASWAVTGSRPASNVAKIAVCHRALDILAQRWPEYASHLIEDIKTSQPEQSKDFDKSQLAVAAAGERWAQLQREFLQEEHNLPQPLQDTFRQTASEIVTVSVDLLRTRKGKPYGSAAVVDEFVNHFSESLSASQATHNDITSFMHNDAPAYLFSPSQRQIFSTLYHLHADPQFEELWGIIAVALAEAPESAEKISGFRNFLASPRVKKASALAKNNDAVQGFIWTECQSLLTDDHDWTFMASILQHSADILAAETRVNILSFLMAALTMQDQSKLALNGLDHISKTNSGLLKEFVTRPEGSQLLPKLLLLEDSSDNDIAEKASQLGQRLTRDTDSAETQSATVGALQKGVIDTSQTALPIHTLVEMAGRTLEQSGHERLATMMPDVLGWQSALDQILCRPAPKSLAISNPLGGALCLVQDFKVPQDVRILRDNEGYSCALRVALFVSNIIQDQAGFDHIDAHTQVDLMYLISLSVVLASDNLSISRTHFLWENSSADVEAEMIDFVSQTQRLIRGWVEQSSENAANLLDRLLERARSRDVNALYNARAFSWLQGEVSETHGFSAAEGERWVTKIQELRKSKDTLAVVAVLSAFEQALSGNAILHRYCNEMIADLTAAKPADHAETVLEQLVVLNVLLRNLDVSSGFIAKQRIVFFVKHILPWLHDSSVKVATQSEALKALTATVPGMVDLYGEHWSQLLSAISGTWKSGFLSETTARIDEERLNAVHASLRLFGTLRGLKAAEEPNDDLVDAWKEAEPEMAVRLVGLLSQSQEVPDDSHQPLKMTNDLIAREIERLPKVAIGDASTLYPLLYAPSHSIQRTSFGILHKHIPAVQEQISFDAALENKTAQLPEELLSLILETPTLDSLVNASFERTIPVELQGYLYGWLLIFDHFSNSSYKVKMDYADILKESDYLAPLFDFTFDFLGHTRGKPVDVSKFDIATYTPDTQETPEKETQLLLAHIYYLALFFIPSLAKAHFLAISSRQTSLAVSSWTSKYISPHIIAASLDSVSSWAKTTQSDPEYENLTVKVNTRTKEVNVGYLVDEQTMAIVVRLPDSYPLSGASVEGVSRVAVDEKRWQSWLRNCQGVITFSNGNLVDGLSSWRKNVNGALKGQTECAICYSIISSDKQLPSKRCGTCKNLFHSSCLYKWFKSSNASSCPLCRNAFNYG